MNAGSLYAPRDQPEKESKKEKERKKKTQGDQTLVSEAHNFIFKKDFYTFPTNDVVYIIFWPWRSVKRFKTLFW